jgi:acetoacetyl-CoA synthetase
MWMPSESFQQSTEMFRFMRFVEKKYSAPRMSQYSQLHKWTVTRPGDFWLALWDFVKIKASVPPTRAFDSLSKFPGCKFFPGALMNFAENMLKYRDERPAIIWQCDSSAHSKTMSYRELYDQVSVVSQALRKARVKVGDRVAGFIPNLPSAVVAMLAATSIGAIWSSCSPDFGIQGVLDRFGQIEPTVLFTTTAFFFKGKRVCLMDKLKNIVNSIKSLKKVVFVPYTEGSDFHLSLATIKNGVHLEHFVAGFTPTDIEFEQLPFDHPVYIMYSSGTTGLPKCIVQGPGVLINHMKEMVLHCNISRDDNVFYYTTTGWMMWNWLISALAVGATVVIWEGNPCFPEWDSLWEMAEKTKLTLFGTSAAYLQAIMNAGCEPGSKFDLSNLRTICSTGSPATDIVFEYVYSKIKPDVQFASISGGTDLNGCFALGCPILPVHLGELQCLGLGLDVAILDEDGKAVEDTKGELCCRKPFPSGPLFFWNDVENKRFHDAYFDHFKNTWRHGDFAKITPRGGMIIYGRSDATLNAGGIRIGTADIYRVVDETIAEVRDSVIVGKQVGKIGGDEVKVVLFVLMAEGCALTPKLKHLIRNRIRDACSARHVPNVILTCPDIPYTISGKKVELAVKKALEGKAIKNKSALRNPDCLEFYIKAKV